MKKTPVLVAVVPMLILGICAALPAAAQDGPTALRGEAILDHPAGKLALQMAELLFAGKVEEAIRLKTSAEQSDWKKASSSHRHEMTARMKERAPDPKALADAIRKGGELTLNSDGAGLIVPMGANATVVAYFDLEGGKWRGASGPMMVAGSAEPAKETRIQGAEILKHPVGDLALRYADALHGGPMDDAMKLASSKAQADWKTLPASERAESTAFRKKMVPRKNDLAAGIQAGGILIIEDDSRATLNVVQFEQKSSEPGTLSSSSSTIAIPFVLEGGQWKLAQ